MNIETLKAYVRNELNEEERKQVELAAANDEEVQAVLEGLKVTMASEPDYESYIDQSRQSVKSRLMTNQPIPLGGASGKKRNNINLWIRVAAVLLLISVTGYFLIKNLSTPRASQLVESYLSDKDPLGIGSRGGDPETPEWVNQFELGNYNTVVTQLSQKPDKSDTELLYLGISFTNLSDYDKALATFPVIGAGSPLKNAAHFFEALTLYKAGNQSGARVLFDRILRERTFGYEKVEALNL